MADYWMKLYIEILDDPKMATMPDRAWRRTIEIFLVAKKLNKDGHLPETRQIAWLLRMNTDELEHDLIQIASTGIIAQEAGGWYIPKFVQRQAAVPDDERKRQQRDREKSQQYYGDVTDTSRGVTQRTEDREQKTDTDTDTDTETEQKPTTPPENKKMFGAIARICQLDMKLQAGRIGKAVKQLTEAQYASKDIDNFGEWWKENDWRGKKGDVPTMAQVIDNIYKSKNHATPIHIFEESH